MNLFVGPQFPELGWDAVQQPKANVHNLADHGPVDQGMEEQIDEQESMVMNPSQNSVSSVNVQLQLGQDNFQIMHVGLAFTHVYGPVIPPEMQWRQAFEVLLPEMLARKIIVSPSVSPFSLLLGENSGCFSINPKHSYSSVVSDICVLEDSSAAMEDSFSEVVLGVDSHSIDCSFRRPVARSLNFGHLDNEQEVNSVPPLFACSPVSVPKKRGRPRKMQVPVVEPENRRFTRSSLKLQGYKPKPVIEKVKPMKTRAKLLVRRFDQSIGRDSVSDRDEQENQNIHTPQTPIPVMQRVGRELGIAPEKLSKELLEAAPKDHSATSFDD
jgi:hypothetical protein